MQFLAETLQNCYASKFEKYFTLKSFNTLVY